MTGRHQLPRSRPIGTMARTRVRAVIVFVFFLGIFPEIAIAETVNIAVAANFTEPAQEIAQAFREKTGHEAVLSFGSSGQFYTQITQAAPFQVFLSADAERPRKLMNEGYGVAGEAFTYAIGKLVLWSPRAGVVSNEETLEKARFSKIAIANPAAAPYGAAAIEVMTSLNAYERLRPKIVEGSSIAQAFQFVKTENAELGFIALSQIKNQREGSWWIVPQKYYRPILQDAILLAIGANNAGARAFMAFLKTKTARTIIEKFGYDTAMIDGQEK